MAISAEQVRFLAFSMLTAESDRDRQEAIGASDLCNPCDHCLAVRMSGRERTNEFAERPFLGRVLGTGLHGVMEGKEAQRVARSLFPQAVAEQKVTVCHIPGYGDILGHFDEMPDPFTVIDWKGSERKKLFPLIDYFAIQRGEEAPYGRTHANVKLSEKQYAETMASMAHKVQGYYGQAQGYLRGAGPQAKQAFIVFINRDGTGYNDNPAFNNYDNPKAVHDIWVLPFQRNDAYMDALIQRATNIWRHLEGGGATTDFASAEHCFVCKNEVQSVEKLPDMTFEMAA